MKIYQGTSLVAPNPPAAVKALPAMRARRFGAGTAASLLCSLLWLAGCGQKGPLTLPPAKAPASTASSPAH